MQLSVMVWDSRRPQQTATGTLTCVMSRNENKPEFDREEYRVTINDRYEQGAEVAQVAARDQDQVIGSFNWFIDRFN